MSKAVKILITIASLLAFGAVVSFYISSQQEVEFSYWEAQSLMTIWDRIGIILLFLAGALALAARKLYWQGSK